MNKGSLLQKSLAVIPAKAGIQSFQDVLDPGFRRGAGFVEFCKSLRGQGISQNKGSQNKIRGQDKWSSLVYGQDKWSSLVY